MPGLTLNPTPFFEVLKKSCWVFLPLNPIKNPKNNFILGFSSLFDMLNPPLKSHKIHKIPENLIKSHKIP